MYQACSVVCKVEDFKLASNNFRSEFIGKDQTGRKQYRGISFKKTQFGSNGCSSVSERGCRRIRKPNTTRWRCGKMEIIGCYKV